MAIELRLDRTVKIAQTVHIRTHELVSDISLADGGDDTGPSPHDLYDAALGACWHSLQDVVGQPGGCLAHNQAVHAQRSCTDRATQTSSAELQPTGKAFGQFVCGALHQ